MDVISVRTPSLGDATYIVDHAGSAIVVDPQRDIGRFLDVVSDRGLTITHVLETHLHNDYISGGRDLSKQTGADLILPAASGAAFPFIPAFHQEDLDGRAGLVIRPLHTPGHTPEHTSYLILLDGEPAAVFTGGSLLVGAAGRSDLLGLQYAEMLSTLQYGSLQRLAKLPDATGVFPTHGEGSFCTASGAGRTTSTIGQEKAENPLFAFADAETFVKNQLSVLVPYPTYYAHMGPTNKQNPTALRVPDVPDLGPDDVANHLTAGGVVLDGRDREAFAAGHVPGSIGIELGDSYAPWAGWLIDYNAPLMLVLDRDQDAVMAATELGRIGFVEVAGVMRGVDEWRESGRELASFGTVTIGELTAALESDADLQVIDVRDPKEWEAGHLEGSVHRYVPDLRNGLPEGIDPSRPVWLVCRTGNRSTIAAGLVEDLGVAPIVVTKGGVPDVVSPA
jgi:glyoxylase-like metal-dependent hydrolase (beta-lactamase superfamily II)/rhodanese-related sulfurtransferase